MMQIAIIGSGAMGSLFGGLLSRDGHDVTLVDVWAEHVDAIERDGLRIETPSGDGTTIDVSATTDPRDAGTVDLAIVFVKSTHTDDAVADATSILDDTDVLTLQNGLGNPERIEDHVPEDRIIAGVTAHGSTLVEPGHVIHAGEGPTTIGRYFTDNDPLVEAIAEAFTAAGIETTVTDDIRETMWEKVLVNVGINAPTALSRVKNGVLADTDAGRRIIDAAVSEAAIVAEAHGVDVRDDIVSYVTDIAVETGENRSSMRQDVEAGRRTEIEYLNGEVVRRGERAGVPVPVNRTLTDLVTLTEHRS